MARYRIAAPDGGLYEIDGPEGASDDQVRAAVLQQHPNAGAPPSGFDPAQIGVGAPPPTADSRNAITRGFQAVSEPFTKAYGIAIDPLGEGQKALSQLTGGRVPAPGATAGESIARFVVPQTPTGALVAGATAGAGPAISAARGLGVPGMQALTKFPALGRVLAGTGAAGAGAGLEGHDVLPEMAGTGATLAALEAVFGKGLPWLLKAIPGAKTRVAHQDAERMLAAAPQVSAGLGRQSMPGDTASQRLQALVTQGKQGLSDAKEEATQLIESALAQAPRAATPFQTPGGAANVPDIVVSSLGGRVTLRAANAELTAIGEGLRNADILDPVLRQRVAGRRYAELSDEIRRGLDAEVSGLGMAFQRGQEEFRAGMELLKDLARPGNWRPGASASPEFDPGYLQRLLAKNPKITERVMERMGPGASEFVDALTRGAGLGGADVLAPGKGTLGASLGEAARGRNTGFWSWPLAALRTVLPGAGTSYIAAPGRQPFATDPGLQVLIDLLGNQAMDQARRSGVSLGPQP